MKIIKYVLIFALFLVLVGGIGAVSAAINDAADTVSEVNDIVHSNDDGSLSEDSLSDSSKNDISKQSSNDPQDILTEDSPSQKIQSGTNNKTNLKISTKTNLVERRKNYSMYLRDSKNNPVANKKLNIKFNGKNYTRTTDKDGCFKIKISLSKSSTS